MRLLSYLFFSILFFACNTTRKMNFPVRTQASEIHTGTEFYQITAAWKWAKAQILSGNYPSFLRKFVRINVSVTGDDGKIISAWYFVAPDYLSLGTEDDWARIPLTPMAAQIIADSFHCFLPTRKMVDDIYTQSVVKLAPVPMYAFRDSSVTMWQHHLIVEGQRKGRKGLISGIKKDVVLSGKLIHDAKPEHEAIYGWHKLDGKAIQPLYTGHINWWVDYSHGIRLVYHTIWVDGKPMDYTAVFKDPKLQKLLCDEEWCDCVRY
jgi:hypothetical protein